MEFEIEGKHVQESQELINLCTQCKKMDCISDNGCAEYRAIKRGSSFEKKNPTSPEGSDMMLFEATGNDVKAAARPIAKNMHVNAPARTLAKCNCAIEALDELFSDTACEALMDLDKLGNFLQDLKAARVMVYSPAIDWEAIVKRLEANEK